MTIDEVIKLKEAYLHNPLCNLNLAERIADQLSIEALKRLKEQRSRTTLDEYDFLPGETQ